MQEALMDTTRAGYEQRSAASEGRSPDNVALDMDKQLDAMRREMLRGRSVDMQSYEELVRIRGEMLVHFAPPRRYG